MMYEPVETERVVIHAPKGTLLALERAAFSIRRRPAEFARSLLLEGLQANGFVVADEASVRARA